MAKMGELKRAAQTLGVTSSTLRQHGWKTAAPARVQAALDDRPDWLTAAREFHRNRFAKHQRRRAGQGAASRLGIQLRAVKERGVGADDVEDLLAAQPDWLVAEQRRRQAQVEREAADTLHRQLADTLIASVTRCGSKSSRALPLTTTSMRSMHDGHPRSTAPSARRVG